jgi:hypothetical protein
MPVKHFICLDIDSKLSFGTVRWMDDEANIGLIFYRKLKG